VDPYDLPANHALAEFGKGDNGIAQGVDRESSRCETASDCAEDELKISAHQAVYMCGDSLGEHDCRIPPIDGFSGIRQTSDIGGNADNLAERVRFELTSPVKGLRFSRPVHSTALPPLRSYISVSYSTYIK
jgi:hypothetical protein